MNLSYKNNYSNEGTTWYGFHTGTGKGSIMAEHVKNQIIPPFFFEILQRYYKLSIMSTLGMLAKTSKNDTTSL